MKVRPLLVVVAACLVVGAGAILAARPTEPVSAARVYQVVGDFATPVVGYSTAAWIGVLNPGDYVLDEAEVRGSAQRVAGQDFDGWVSEEALRPVQPGGALAGLSPVPRARGA